MVRAAEHEAAVLAERVDEPHDLVSHVVDGAAREDLQDVHASVEGEPVAEVVLQALRLHSLRVRLDRIEQVDTELDQLRDERVDRAVAVVHHGHAALVRELRQPRVMRSHCLKTILRSQPAKAAGSRSWARSRQASRNASCAASSAR